MNPPSYTEEKFKKQLITLRTKGLLVKFPLNTHTQIDHPSIGEMPAYMHRFVLNNAQKRLAAGLRPNQLGELKALPQTP